MGTVSISLTEEIKLVHNITRIGRKGESEAAPSPHSTLEIKPYCCKGDSGFLLSFPTHLPAGFLYVLNQQYLGFFKLG